MFTRKKIFAAALTSLTVVGFVISSGSVSALNQNDVMDDAIMDNYNSMSAGSIDAFLNTFPSSCISPNSGFSAIDPVGYNPSDGYLYGGNVSAGTVIYHASQAYQINPQVLLATMQKEQSLVSGAGGCSTNTIAKTMGYACPDSGGSYSYSGLNLYTRNGTTFSSVSGICVNTAAKAGFTQQVIRGAWLLKFSEQRSEGNINWAIITGNWNNSDDLNSTYSGYMTQGCFKRSKFESTCTNYDGYTTIDSTSVHIDTGATAALYRYTPHFSGNTNFVNIFTNWFGRTTGPVYNWQLQNVSYSTGTNTFGLNQTGTVTVTVKNTGNVPWYNYGANPVRLGTWLPDRVSPLASPGWVSNTRPANMTETQVDPGGTATFVFPITARALGTYVEHLNLVVENSQWLPDIGLSPTINVVNPYQWKVNDVTYGNGTGLMTPGTSQLITVTALNTGLSTWSRSTGPSIRLGTWQAGRTSQLVPAAGSTPKDWINSIRPAEMNESTVAPGQVGNFQFYVTVPRSGTFYENFNLVAEGQNWFNDPGLTLYNAGSTYGWKPLWSSYSTGGDAHLARGTTFTVTLKAQNTGTATWTKSSTVGNPWAVRLATTGPMNRGSMLYDSSWLSDIRPVGLQESSVAPGGQGTFVFTAHIANNAAVGPHYENFSLVAEGEAWFNDPGFSFYVDVQ